ncbi:restriction endonuclease subunit S [Gemmata sp. JC673]|uniref:Restriction endonuclease subunit S n=1 Tax=Gemmata algarum TaxID=2975278 RepID=A0ABU5EYA2_9BACT|nr:restriction endonuclease subunit S [Gemmata algarum]MDY3560229.1 restriction endonuclease subunit S [Gemmata algarum]
MSDEAIETPPPNSRWATTVGAICDKFGGEIQTGPFGSQLHASDYSEDGTPVVMPQDMKDGQVVCDRIARVDTAHVQRLQRHELRVGDVIFSRRGDVARFAIVTESESGWLCGTGSIRIRLNSPDICIGYVRRYLQQRSVGKWLEHNAKGQTMPNLNTDIIRALPFVYPPLLEQQRIAAILDHADALRAKRRAALAKLDALPQAIFGEMFGDPVTNPKGWPTSSVGDQLVFQLYGPRFYNEVYSTNGVRIVRITDLDEFGRLDFAAMPRLIVAAEDLEKYSLRAGDILFARTGATVGKVALIGPDAPVCIAGAYFIVMRFGPAIDPAYARAVLTTPKIQDIVQVRSKQSAQQNFSGPGLRALPMPLPPLPLQQEFAKRVAAVERVRSAHRASLVQLDALFASLQYRAFRGEL